MHHDLEENEVKTMSKANVNKLGYIGSVPGTERDSDSWYTPSTYIESARSAMGSIDLDPFSSTLANERVGATHILTEADDALTTSWDIVPGGANVWMNPPYSGQLIKKAVKAFVNAYESGYIKRGIVLVNNATDTIWFKELRAHSRAVCLTDHRIAFVSPDGKAVSGNTRGQCFLYFGDAEGARQFAANFNAYGWVVSTSWVF